jgi:Arc/MetJ-type ribon-helix-helix transcriptional regulator
MPRKPLVVTFRLDEATRDRIRETVRYSPHRDVSTFIREAIARLLAREEERPSGRTVPTRAHPKN